MIIDDSVNSSAIRNVSYLIPIGICINLILSCTKDIASAWMWEWGISAHLDSYVNFWLSNFLSLLLVLIGSYFFVRSLWRRIATGELNCSRLFVSLLVLSIVFVGLSFASHYVISIFEESRIGTPKMHTRDYLDFIMKVYPYKWFVEFTLLIFTITFATRSPQETISTDRV